MTFKIFALIMIAGFILFSLVYVLNTMKFNGIFLAEIEGYKRVVNLNELKKITKDFLWLTYNRVFLMERNVIVENDSYQMYGCFIGSYGRYTENSFFVVLKKKNIDAYFRVVAKNCIFECDFKSEGKIDSLGIEMLDFWKKINKSGSYSIESSPAGYLIVLHNQVPAIESVKVFIDKFSDNKKL